MPDPAPRAVIRYIRRIADDGPQEQTDADVLRAFLARNDQPAFAEIVRRHGPMVLSVCRRVLRHEADAEDAFQATFLLLARKAGSVRNLGSLGSWLHGVAFRVASDARKLIARRQEHEGRATVPSSRDPALEAAWHEIQSLLDEEIRNLPAPYREAFVLCCLENQSCGEVAARLGIKEGTVWSRVAWARERLRARLSLRGISLTALLAAAAVSGNTALAAVRAELMDATAMAAAGMGSGESLSALCSPNVITLVEGTAMVMGSSKLMGGAIVLLLIGLVTTGLGLFAQQPGKMPPDLPARGGPEKPRTDLHGDALPPGAVARLGTVRQRTTATAFAVSSDGKTLITIAGGRTIGRWAADTGRLLDETHLPGPLAHETWFSADGQTVAVAEQDKLSVWDTSTGKRVALLSVQASHVAFTPDGKSLATATSAIRGGKDQLRIWDLKTGKDRQLAEIPSYANDLAFDAKGERLFAAVDNHSLRCWDVSTGKQLWQNDAWASRIGVSPDGRLLCSNRYLGGPTFLWDASTGEKIASLGEDRVESSQVAFSPDGRSLAQGTWKDVLVWDVESRKLRHRLEGAGPRLVFAPDGKSLFTMGQMLLRWDVATGKPRFADVRGDGHVGPLLSVAFASDGKTLASGGADRTVRIWEVGSGKHRILGENGPANGGRQVGGEGGFHAFSVGTVQFTPDNKFLVTDVAAGTLALTDVTTGKEVRKFQLPKPKKGWVTVAAAHLTADGKTLLASSHTTAVESFSYDALARKEGVRAWDVTTGREMLSCEVPSSGSDYGSVFSPDGWLFAPGYSKHVYDLRQEGGPVPTVLKPEGLWPPAAFSPDGRLFAAAEVEDSGPPGKAVRILEVLTGRQVARVEMALGYGRGMAFSPDSRLLAVSGSDALHVWESSTGRRLLHLAAQGRLTNWTPAGFAGCLAFAPDGGTLATGHGDGTILLWDLSTARKELGKSQNDSDAAACWADLAGEDAGKAYAGIARLASIPEQALPLLRRELKPEKVDPKWLAARLAELDSDRFETREAASRELKKVAEAVEGELRRELKRTSSAEVRRQIAGVLEALAAAPAEAPSPDKARRLRALVALERIASKDALALLRDLAGGDADARLTREARAALRRLGEGE